MLIQQITFIETDDSNFQLNFIYKGKNLQTVNIPRNITTPALVGILQAMCNEFDLKRAQTNYDALKTTYEGKSANI